MTMMVSELYEALVSAGAPEDQARKAAAALAGYDNRFNRVETDFAVLKWMVGAVIAGIVALVMKAFF